MPSSDGAAPPPFDLYGRPSLPPDVVMPVMVVPTSSPPRVPSSAGAWPRLEPGAHCGGLTLAAAAQGAVEGV